MKFSPVKNGFGTFAIYDAQDKKIYEFEITVEKSDNAKIAAVTFIRRTSPGRTVGRVAVRAIVQRPGPGRGDGGASSAAWATRWRQSCS